MKAIENSKYIGEWDESLCLYRITRKSDGLRGGFIEGLHNLSEHGNCWVYDNATVRDSARVSGNARVFGSAIVCDSALVGDNARVFGSAIVCDNARVRDSATVRDSARVCDSALATQKVFNLYYDRYIITGTDNHLRIGCKQYTYEEWWNFTDEEITEMDEGALEWWNKWKPILQAVFTCKGVTDESNKNIERVSQH